MFDSILVICTGNICRSPIAERILRKIFPNKKIDSAGVGAMVGYPADDSASHVPNIYNISLQGHKAQQFTSNLARQYELILVMEKKHIEDVSRIAPEARGKTMLLGQWLNKSIPDPYRKSDEVFNLVFKLIDEACQSWAKKLN